MSPPMLTAIAGSKTTAAPQDNAEFVTIARVGKTQGRHGEVAAELHTDFPEKFAERRKLSALLPDGTRRSLTLEDFWPHKGGMVLKFLGFDSINDAELLLGAEIQIPQRERAQLEEGAFYISDLKGCAVFDTSAAGGPRKVGTITDVRFGAGEAPTLIVAGEKDAGGREHMIPYAAVFVKKLDVAGRRIEMELPEGLLELESPLTADEKAQQHRG